MCVGVCKDINIVMVDKQPRYIELLTDARRFSKPVAWYQILMQSDPLSNIPRSWLHLLALGDATRLQALLNTEGDVGANETSELIHIGALDGVVDHGTQSFVLEAEQVVRDLADAEILVRLRRDEDDVLAGRVELRATAMVSEN